MSIKADMSVRERENLILATMKAKDMTVSEIIDCIWDSITEQERIDVGWRFFVHLNKLFTILEKKNKIVVVGKKQGYMNRTEKIWRSL
jgi:hypothetical protein